MAGRDPEALVAGAAEPDVLVVRDDRRTVATVRAAPTRAVSGRVVDKDDLKFDGGMSRRGLAPIAGSPPPRRGCDR